MHNIKYKVLFLASIAAYPIATRHRKQGPNARNCNGKLAKSALSCLNIFDDLEFALT